VSAFFTNGDIKKQEMPLNSPGFRVGMKVACVMLSASLIFGEIESAAGIGYDDGVVYSTAAIATPARRVTTGDYHGTAGRNHPSIGACTNGLESLEFCTTALILSEHPLQRYPGIE
jgi:hypothetical protein